MIDDIFLDLFSFILFIYQVKSAVMDSSTSAGGSACRLVRPPFKGIRFLRATSKDDKSAYSAESKTEDSFTESGIEAGREARDFYESVISTQSSSASIKRSSTHAKTVQKFAKDVRNMKSKNATLTPKPMRSHRQSERQVQTRALHKFLRSAQEGDVKTIDLLLEEGSIDINAVDDYAWTALMCASYSGQPDVVALLLRKGALWECFQDKSGQTALDLSRRAGHLDIVAILEGHQCSTTNARRRMKKRCKNKKFWCDICDLEFRESSQEEHQSSTVHLFNCQHKPQSTMYYIPESNVGFQLMMKDGWDKEKGLGPDGSGFKFPVKTVLKRDRKGLGAEDRDDKAARARITHFKPFDVDAVKRPCQPEERKLRTTTLNKRARKQSEMRERKWERDFRQSFNQSL